MAVDPVRVTVNVPVLPSSEAASSVAAIVASVGVYRAAISVELSAWE